MSSKRPHTGILVVNGLRYQNGNQRLVHELGEVVRYRELLQLLIINSFRARYKRSILGLAWALLNPLLMTLILMIVFSRLFDSSLRHYGIYVFVGLCIWNFLTQTVTSAMNHMVWGSGLMNRIYIPRTIFTLAAVGAGVIDLCLALTAVVIVVVLTGHPITSAVLILPAAIILSAVFVLGLALILSILSAFFADVLEVIQVVFLAVFFLTPIIYPVHILPDVYERLVYLNPIYDFVALFRSSLYFGVIPPFHIWMSAVIWAGVSGSVGWFIFTKRINEIAYRV